MCYWLIIRHFNEPVVPTSSRCPIYLKLLWFGRKCQLLADWISACVTLCYNAFKLNPVFQMRSAFLSFSKDQLSYFQNSSVIYKLKCCCNMVYIGWINQRLETLIMQHVPAYLCSSSQSHVLRTTQAMHDFLIWQNLLDNPNCDASYDDTFFPSYVMLTRFSIYESLILFSLNFISQGYVKKKKKRNILFVPYIRSRDCEWFFFHFTLFWNFPKFCSH